MENEKEEILQSLKEIDDNEMNNVTGGTDQEKGFTPPTIVYVCRKCSWSGPEAIFTCPVCNTLLEDAYNPVTKKYFKLNSGYTPNRLVF